MRVSPIVASLLAIAIATPSSQACKWDRDTLKSEARGDHDLLNVITGRFPRNPPSFYETRLAKVVKLIAADPDNLGLYDDAGVACDTLNRPAEAIQWMEKKAVILAANPNKDQQYRYHANLGTFLIHQWLAGGADPQLPGGKAGAEHIRQAIEINPDAHFGREAVQLQAIEWILAERTGKGQTGELSDRFGSQGRPVKSELKEGSKEKNEARDFIEGLSGMVTLGSAWESVDIFNALAVALNADGRASVAYLARLRAQELGADGKTSFSPRAEYPDEVRPYFVHHPEHLDAWYREARSAADAWQEARTGFIEAEIAKGRHPDTNPEFWGKFDLAQHPLPALSEISPYTGKPLQRINYFRTAALIAVILFALVILLRVLRKNLRRRRHLAPQPTP